MRDDEMVFSAEDGVGVRPSLVLDLMGGKSGCAFGDGAASPTLTRGRASAGDVRAVVIEEG